MTPGRNAAGGYLIPITRPWLPPLRDYVAQLDRIWSSRMLSNFAECATALEALAADYLGAAYVLTVSSGDIALILALRALQLPPRTRVLVPSFTFNSTVNAILWNNLTPAFVDIDPETLNIDPVDAAKRIDGAGAIVATHVFGNPAPIDELARLAGGAGARLLFDAAHGYGSLRQGKHVGRFGDAEVFSLSGTKLVTSAEGGLFATSNPELAERFRYLRAYGFQYDYHSRYVGLNGKLSELHAALGLLTLARIEDALAARKKHVDHYLRRLVGVPGATFQRVSVEDRSTYKDFAVLFATGEQRYLAEAALTAADVQTKRYFRPCHQMEAYRPYAHRPLPATESVYRRILCLPLFEDLTSDQVDSICDIVEAAVGTGAGRHRSTVREPRPTTRRPGRTARAATIARRR
jgi:dTDP-4-amino-4,6-dideoxygalactose transaminase